MTRSSASAAVLVLVTLLTSGCASDRPEPTPSTAPATLPPSDPTATTAAPNLLGAPQWSLTTRWTWTLTSQVLPAPLVVTTGVVKDTGTHYHVGIDSQPHYERAYPLHILPLGEIQKSDLAWDAHGKPVSLLRFPLQHQEQWTTDLWIANGLQIAVLEATVQTPRGPADGYAINVTYPGGGIALFAEYAPALGQFVRISAHFGGPAPFSSAVLTDVTDTPTDVVAFSGAELVRRNTPGGSPPSPPNQFAVTAGPGFVLSACFMGGAQGAYAANVLAPDGWHGDCSHTNPPGQTATVLQTQSHPLVAGTWAATTAPPAQGFTNLEAFLVRPLA